MNRRRDLGFSLLELVVVLAIFSLVALIGVQVIRATVLADRRLAEVSEASEELALGLALLRRDMRAAIGVGFVSPNGISEPALRIGPDGFGLSVGGLAGVAQGGAGPGLGRVVWRLDPASGRLTRQVWTALAPGTSAAASPEVVQLTGVTRILVESFTDQAGWQPNYAPDPRDPNTLPRGLRVRLDTRSHDRIETLVALR